MADEIQIWEIDGTSQASKVEQTRRTETEEQLEDILVKNPEMLMQGLTLVGRQTPAAGGALDLLGVDRYGKLVVFELKRSAPTRDAVAQVIDYCSYLEELTEGELSELISKFSGLKGIERIPNFEEWYSVNRNGRELEELKPIRMALVGVGLDESANRMVNFLMQKDVDIISVSFSAYVREGRTLLARQVHEIETGTELPSSRYARREKRRANLDERARTLGIGDFWQKVIDDFTRVHRREPSPRANGYTFYQQNALRLPGLVGGHRAGASHTVRLDKDGKIRVTFFPIAVHLCKALFDQIDIIFGQEEPADFQATDQVDMQYYCLFDEEEWNKQHKRALLNLASEINGEWDKKLQELDA